MSESTLFGVDKNLNYKKLKTYQNSWGTMPVIWFYYGDIKGYGKPFGLFLEKEEKEGFWNKLDETVKDKKTPISERLAIYMTYYPVAIHKSGFKDLANGLRKISKRCNNFYENERVNHLESVANDILEYDSEYICLKGTSVDDSYEFYNEEKDDFVKNLKEIKDEKVKDDFEFIHIENGGLVIKNLLKDVTPCDTR